MPLKILLIDTPSTIATSRDVPRVTVPQAALYLASSLRRAGYSPIIYDPKLSIGVHPWKSVFYGGDSFDEIEARIRLEKPDFIGITNPLSKDTGIALEISQRAKAAASQAVVAIGGFHATACPRDILACEQVDIAAIGEGEETIIELAKCIEQGGAFQKILGIAFRDKTGEIIINPTRPINHTLPPFPQYDCVDLERYFTLAARGFGGRPMTIGKRTLSVFTSRGCPFHCFFCGSHTVTGRKFRARAAGEVLEHVREMVRRYAIDSVEFEDDNVSADRGRFEAIVDGLAAMRPRLAWATPNGVRADTLLGGDLLERMKASGCRYLTVGVESGDQRLLSETIRKALDLGVVEDLARRCRQVGIPLNAFFIVGFPGETVQQIRTTFEFARSLHRRRFVYPFANFAIPLKGADLYRICVDKGYCADEFSPELLTKSMSYRGKGLIHTPEFSPELIATMLRQFNRIVAIDEVCAMMRNPKLALIRIGSIGRSLPRVKRYFFG